MKRKCLVLSVNGHFAMEEKKWNNEGNVVSISEMLGQTVKV